MAYTPTTWKDGDIITAEKMNKLEQGVVNEQVGPPGPAGADGAPGAQGDPGPGVAPGGTTGQMLRKASDTDYATEWTDVPASGDTYSMQEQKAGTWIDGKPIYRRVFKGTSPTTTGSFADIATVANVSNVVRITWTINNSFDNHVCGQDRESIVGYSASLGKLQIYIAAPNRGGQPYTCIFEYTKTTD